MADETEPEPPIRRDVERSWHHPGGDLAVSDRQAWRRFWLITLAALFLALISVAIVWLLFLRPAPPPPFYLEITIGDYDARAYPIRPFTRQDGDALGGHFPARKRAETKAAELLRGELANLVKHTDPLIIHITALALAREDKVYLLPGNAQPSDESSWIDVAEILDTVGQFRAKHKLLILDLAYRWADDRFGVLSSRVTETLERNLTQNPPAFFVLCPCSAGQASWTSEAMQRSVFAHYLDQGLQGHADFNQDGRITVREIATFLEARVDRWAKENLGVRQQPRLFGAGADFAVGARAPGSVPATPPDPPSFDPYPARLQKAWEERDRRLNNHALRHAPRGIRKLEAHLLRQEALMRGGAVQAKDLPALDDDLQRILRDIDAAMTEGHAAPRSFALALAQTGAKANPLLADLAMRHLADVGAKEETIAAVAKGLSKRLLDEKDANPALRASAVLDGQARVEPLTPNRVRAAHAVIEELAPKQRTTESLFAKRLADFAGKIDPDVWRPENIRKLLETFRLRETVVASLDQEPEFLPWIGRAVVEGDRLRHEAEKTLFGLVPEAWPEGQSKLQSAREIYKEGLDACNTLSALRRTLNRSLAELPASMILQTASEDFVPLDEQAWMNVLAEAEKARAVFANPPKLGAVRGHGLPAFKDPWGPLEKNLRQRIDVARKAETPADARKLMNLLQIPLLSADDRAKVFKKSRELAISLHAANEERDEDDNRQRRASRLPAEAREDATDAVPLARARMSVALLKLAGFESKDKKLAAPQGREKRTARDLAELERALQSAWSKELAQQWRKAESPQRADTLDRIASPWQIDDAAETKRARRRHDQARQAFFLWLANRYEAESQHLDGTPGDREASAFHAAAARDLPR